MPETADELGLSQRAPAPPPPRSEWRLPADAGHVPRARKAIRQFATAHGAADRAIANLCLAVTEAVTNAVLHAYVDDASPGEVLVVAEAADDEIVVCVLDAGRGMQPRPDSPGLGMGLPMIGQLTTSVDIRERPGGGTEVRMRFAAPGVRGPAPDPSIASRRLAGILDALAEAVTVNDESGRTVWLNEAAARLLGAASIDEVLAAGPGDLAARFAMTHEDGTPVGVDELPGRRLLAGDPDPQPLLTRSVHRASGRERWLVTKASLLEDGGERLAVNIIEDVTAAKREELRTRFLARAGEVLGASLEVDRTLQDVAGLVVPALADWCAIELLGEDGDLRRVAVAHRDPERLAAVEELDRLYPAGPSDIKQDILAGGPPLVIAEISDELLRSRARDPHHLELMRSIGLRSALMVGLTGRTSTIGLLVLLTAESGRTFFDADADFAAELGRRIGIAVDNARAFEARPGG